MTFKKVLSLLLIGALVLGPISAYADDAAILDRLSQLEQEIAILKRQLEINKEESDKKAKETPIITANAKDGFSIKSPDNAFKLRLRGYVQADARFFANDQEVLGSPDTFLVRRARPILEGNVGEAFGFYFMPDFGGGSVSLVDAYGDWKFNDAAKLRFGKFKSPFSIERLQSITAANFIELGLPTNLAPNRDTGLQLSGDILGQKLSYALGVFDGTADLSSVDTDNNNDKDLVGRVFVQPFKDSDNPASGLSFGVAASVGQKGSTTLPTYRSPAQATIFRYGGTVSADGEHVRLSPQFSYYYKSFGLLGEYIKSEQDVIRTPAIRNSFEHDAWQLSGTYVLTGEDATFKGVTPRKSFNWAEKTWGAFELAARYSQLDIDDDVFTSGFASAATNVTEANAWALGLNWYLSKNVKWALNYEQTEFDRGATIGDRETEQAVLTRFQVVF